MHAVELYDMKTKELGPLINMRLHNIHLFESTKVA